VFQTSEFRTVSSLPAICFQILVLWFLCRVLILTQLIFGAFLNFSLSFSSSNQDDAPCYPAWSHLLVLHLPNLSPISSYGALFYAGFLEQGLFVKYSSLRLFISFSALITTQSAFEVLIFCLLVKFRPFSLISEFFLLFL